MEQRVASVATIRPCSLWMVSWRGAGLRMTKRLRMDAQVIEKNNPESVPDSPVLLAPSQTKLLAPPTPLVSETDFEEVVRGALEAVGGCCFSR